MLYLDQLKRSRQRILDRWYGNQFGDNRLSDVQIGREHASVSEEFRRRWLGFLFDVMLAFVDDPQAIYRNVYLGERQRCFDPRTPREARTSYFEEVLPADVSALTEHCTGTLGRELEQRLQELHRPLLRRDFQDQVSVLFIGDCLMTEIGHFLYAPAADRGLCTQLSQSYFGAPSSGPLGGKINDSVIALLDGDVELVGLSFFSYEGLPHYRALAHTAMTMGAGVDLERALSTVTDYIQGFLYSLRERSNATILLHNVSGVPGLASVLGTDQFEALEAMLGEMNARIDQVAASHENTILIDERAVVAAEGLAECSALCLPPERFGDTIFRPRQLAPLLARQYLPILESFSLLRRAKVLLVDFDGTLWRGIMAEGPVHHFRDRQELLRRLKQVGMLLVAVSKNDPSAIRWDEIALQPSDFVLEYIGWEAKVHTIQRAAQVLELGLDACVFLDDSPEERGLVGLHLPGVVCMDSRDSATWQSLAHLLDFPNTRASQTAASRTELYRARRERLEHLSAGADQGRLLASLDIQVDASRAVEGDLDRVEELLLRTNQFNCTGARHTKPALRRILADPSCAFFVFRMRDRFGDMGLVGVVIAESEEGDVVLSTVVMSCRAMGYGLEHCMIATVTRSLSGRRTVGLFVPTARNGPAAGLYRDLGFSAAGDQRWILGPQETPLTVPKWLNLEVQ